MYAFPLCMLRLGSTSVTPTASCIVRLKLRSVPAECEEALVGHNSECGECLQDEQTLAEEASRGQAKQGTPTAPLQQETPGRDPSTLVVCHVGSHLLHCR